MTVPLTERLRAIFLGELDDQLVVMNADLLALESDPANADRLKSLFRVTHTLKGAALAAGETHVADICHTLEAMLAEARDGGLALGPAQFKSLFAGADALAEARRSMRASETSEQKGATTGYRHVSGHGLSDSDLEGRPAPEHSPQDHLRIDPAKLDEVLASIEQLLVAIDSVAVDAHASGDVSPKAVAGARFLRSSGRELAERARRLRMRPFSEACEALPRVVRDLSLSLGKEVKLTVVGGDVHADRVILDGLREAIVHLVRNSIDHGVEPPLVRAAAGKPTRADLTVAASISGDSINVTVEDDGAGLDMAAIRAGFERLGRSLPADDDALVAALFAGGVSTRAEATAVSGRGVGLDLVRNAVEKIHGSVEASTSRGRGTRFTLRSPLTLASIRALLVKVGTETVALPTAHVERVLRITPSDVLRTEGNDVLAGTSGGSERPTRLVSLARLLGPPLTERPLDKEANAVVLEAQGRRLAVLVDELNSEQLVIVRGLEAAGASLPHLSGVAILGGGVIALVANVPRLLADGIGAPAGDSVTVVAADDPPARRRILVVDDSITTRMLEQSVLEASGYEVGTAIDGANAWSMLAETSWDLVVSDVEMPRMDGFSLCAAIKSSPRLAGTPVVLVTALEKQEHRAKGLEAGADAYIGKSSFDQRSLLETIKQLLG